MSGKIQLSSEEGHCQLTARLLDLMHRTQYELIQENGQRRLTAPELTQEMRDRIKGAEVFLGRLPRDCYEDEIMPIFEQVGRLLELRLMLDFSGTTRGYAFALFEDGKTARKACEYLDGYEIRPGHKIGVVKSIDNCRLFFGGVPKDKTKAEFAEELGKILNGISDIYLYPNAQNRAQNRGFIFVEFKDHRSAAMARRQLIPGRIVLWDHEIAVDWADPEPGDPVDDEVMETVTALFVRNLPLETSHQKIREIFQRTTGIPILKLKKINHFAFIHYETRDLAQKVFDIMSKPGGVADKNQWEIRWAKPIGASKMLERQRSINEAVKASLNQNEKPARSISTAGGSERRRRKAKQQTDMIPDNQRSVLSADPAGEKFVETSYRKFGYQVPNVTDTPLPDHLIDFRQVLEDIVLRIFGGHCQYLCMQVFAPPGYVCKISIVHDEHILYEFQGEVLITEALAINVTSRNAYYRLSREFGEPSVYPAPVYPQAGYPQSRVETCR